MITSLTVFLIGTGITFIFWLALEVNEFRRGQHRPGTWGHWKFLITLSLAVGFIAMMSYLFATFIA